MINITKIYLVTNIDNDPNKVYIGKTKNSRKIVHIHRWGNQITYDYIDEINSLEKKEWEPLESYWIEQIRQWGFNVVNKNKGGGGRFSYNHSEETKEKMRRPHIGAGIKIGLALQGGNRSYKGRKTPNKGKSILQYDKQDNFIKEWKSGKEACMCLKIKSASLSMALKGTYRNKTAGGFKWKYNRKPKEVEAE